VAVAQQMSDDQVVQYVKDAQKMGKNSEADYNRVDEKGRYERTSRTHSGKI